jgi:glyoxylase-like metal-dependent hydrolase (beta-lactamase superfamily II)
VFPNARVHVQRTEWNDALANKSTMTRTYLRTHLEPIAGVVELHDGMATPLDRIALIPTPGHTWGHQSVLVLPDRSDASSPPVLFAGDVCPTIHHAHPAASLGYDMLAYDAMLSKREILGRAAREEWRLAFDHDPQHAWAQVIERDGRIEVLPAR